MMLEAKIGDIERLVEVRFKTFHVLLDTLSSEREKRYDERAAAQDKAVTTALLAAETLHKSMYAASQKAIDKAEAAQREYNERSNEFRQALDDAQKNMMTRGDAQSEFVRSSERVADVRKDIEVLRNSTQISFADLRDTRSQMIGKSAGISGTLAAAAMAVGLMLSLLGIGAGVLLRGSNISPLPSTVVIPDARLKLP